MRRIIMIELDQLQAFLAVADTGSFSAAAEQIHLTQPAVSKRINSLESRLGQTLFNRLRRGVTLTEAGKLLVPKAEALLSQAQDIERHMQDINHTVTGTLAIGISHHIGLHRLPKILKRFSQRYPEANLEITLIDSEQAQEALVAGKIELGIVTLPPKSHASIHATPVWHDPLSIVTHLEHPLQQLKTVTPQSLCKHPAILPHRKTITRQIITQAFKTKNTKPEVVIETNYLETNRMLISVGLGWGIIPNSMRNHSVAPLVVKGIQLERMLGYLRHAKQHVSSAAQAMIDLIEADNYL